ncbi:hypothetical protein AB0M61_26410 [Streptomyces sp. NPDC051642]|uniref:hypothetical protein n=1 Tax=Streptomyces sp. NPDC051642 TaxID=3154646 RepID=UPI00341BBE42
MGARVDVGGHDPVDALVDTPAGQDRGKVIRAGTEVEGGTGAPGAGGAAIRRRPGNSVARATSSMHSPLTGENTPQCGWIRAPRAGTSTPFSRHCRAPSTPGNSRGDSASWPSGGPYASVQARRTSGARRSTRV